MMATMRLALAFALLASGGVGLVAKKKSNVAPSRLLREAMLYGFSDDLKALDHAAELLESQYLNIEHETDDAAGQLADSQARVSKLRDAIDGGRLVDAITHKVALEAVSSLLILKRKVADMRWKEMAETEAKLDESSLHLALEVVRFMSEISPQSNANNDGGRVLTGDEYKESVFPSAPKLASEAVEESGKTFSRLARQADEALNDLSSKKADEGRIEKELLNTIQHSLKPALVRVSDALHKLSDTLPVEGAATSSDAAQREAATRLVDATKSFVKVVQTTNSARLQGLGSDMASDAQTAFLRSQRVVRGIVLQLRSAAAS